MLLSSTALGIAAAAAGQCYLFASVYGCLLAYALV